MVRAHVMLATAFLLAGCYKYAPMNSVAPTRGDDVQVSLNDEGSKQVAPHFGAGVGMLDAKVLAAQADSVQLAVRSARTPTGIEVYTGADTLVLPMSSVSSIAGRKFAAGPAALLGGLLIGGGIGAVAALSGDGGNGRTSTGGGAQPQ